MTCSYHSFHRKELLRIQFLNRIHYTETEHPQLTPNQSIRGDTERCDMREWCGFTFAKSALSDHFQ